jgi:hypothetical protein
MGYEFSGVWVTMVKKVHTGAAKEKAAPALPARMPLI